ncbi:SRPBCC family protein [Nesterenkonia halophila]|uniref:SRPBCC family protein n=1 Tax=Nesterenkonia halophila TaxID=302044 RepID=UPI0012917CFF|nr:SRPBCC family protein [Nesterenkonia halophila]
MSRTPHRLDRGEHIFSWSIDVDASASELYAIIACPHRHHELDGSGTVRSTAIGPRQLIDGDRFRVDMRMKGIPYALTMVTTAAVTDRLVEWRHPGGHRWRWELEPVSQGVTRITESYDFRGQPAPLRRLLGMTGSHAANDQGIRRSLQKVHDRFDS